METESIVLLIGGSFLTFAIFIVFMFFCLCYCLKHNSRTKVGQNVFSLSIDVESGPTNDDNQVNDVAQKEGEPVSDKHDETQTKDAITADTKDKPIKENHIEEDSEASSMKNENMQEHKLNITSENTVIDDKTCKSDTLLIETDDINDNPNRDGNHDLAVTDASTTELPENEHLYKYQPNTQNEHAVKEDTDTVKVQIHVLCKPDTPLIRLATRQLMSKLDPDLRDNYTVIHDITETSSDIPLLILCGTFTRLGTDASNAVRGIRCPQTTVLVILHNKEPHALPSTTSDRILFGKEFADMGGIFDIAYNYHDGMYLCDMNTKCVQNLCMLLHKYVATLPRA